MTNFISFKTLNDLIYLISNYLCDKRPEISRIQSMDLGEIYDLASFHSLLALVACSLETVIPLPYEYDQAKKKAIRKTVLFDIERSKIFQLMDENKIWHMPLKGSILKDYYPTFGVREMSDNDILCDPTRFHDIKRIMEQIGFLCERFDERVDDEFVKGMLAFEIHRNLFDVQENKRFYEYYKDIKKRLIPVEKKPYEYMFSSEDFYIYMIAHEYKHFIHGGTGLRSLIDTFIYLNKCYSTMNWDYIYEELGKLHVLEFEKQQRELSVAVFTGNQLNDSDLEKLMYYALSGTYGISEHKANNHISVKLSGDDSKQAKRKYLMQRIFISGEDLKNAYPFFYKHKWLIPFLQLFRFLKAIVIKPKAVIEEYIIIDNFKAAPHDKMIE